jgi:alkylhydroperoxidase family enzyme
VPSLPSSYATVAGARRGLDVDLSDPRVVAFAEQFAVDVSQIDDAVRAGFLEATGPAAFTAAQAIYVDDFWPRVPAVLGAVRPDVEPTNAELWPLLEEFMREVARLDALDPVLTELVRLRGARQHDCRLCKSRRSVAALAHADETTFDAIDRYADSDLPDRAKAALALTDAVIWTPYAVPAEVTEAASEHLTTDQVTEVVLDVTRNAANKIAVSLGADAATVTDGVELFSTDADGNLTVVGAQPR